MKPRMHRVLQILAVAVFLALSCPFRVNAQVRSDPETVRLSFVQGDVRVSNGKNQKVNLDTAWETAEKGLPIQSGMTIVVGTGRAEIEFENGWTAYLADQSTLEFRTLEAVNNVPHSKLSLLTGTMRIAFWPEEGETLDVVTPTGRTLRFDEDASMRVASFVDAMSVTATGSDAIEVLFGKHNLISPDDDDPDYKLYDQIDPDYTIVYVEGRSFAGSWIDVPGLSDWNEWVTKRIGERETILEAATTDAGLSLPVAAWWICTKPENSLTAKTEAGAGPRMTQHALRRAWNQHQARLLKGWFRGGRRCSRAEGNRPGTTGSDTGALSRTKLYDGDRNHSAQSGHGRGEGCQLRNGQSVLGIRALSRGQFFVLTEGSDTFG